MKLSSPVFNALDSADKRYLYQLPTTFRNKGSLGTFTRGEQIFRPNELARINIPDDERAELIKEGGTILKAPFAANGSIVRVIGLWTHKKLPYRCFPMDMSDEDIRACYLWSKRMADDRMESITLHIAKTGLLGMHIAPEHLVRVDPDKQDQLFISTAGRIGFPVTYDGSAVVPTNKRNRGAAMVQISGSIDHSSARAAFSQLAQELSAAGLPIDDAALGRILAHFDAEAPAAPLVARAEGDRDMGSAPSRSELAARLAASELLGELLEEYPSPVSREVLQGVGIERVPNAMYVAVREFKGWDLAGMSSEDVHKTNAKTMRLIAMIHAPEAYEDQYECLVSELEERGFDEAVIEHVLQDYNPVVNEKLKAAVLAAR